MYRVDDLQSGLLHLIGWRQNHDTSQYIIADSLLESESKLYFQDAHPLLTLDNILSIAPDFSGIVYDAWEGTPKQYYTYDRVTYDSKNYRALRNNVAKQPDTSPDDWERFDEFSEWLETKTKASIVKSIQKFISEKKVIKTARSLFENKALFNRAGSFNELITNAGNWAFLELAPIRANGVSVHIKRVGFQSSKAETFNLYLFHSSSNEYIKKHEISVSKAKTFEWISLTDWVLPYIEDNDAGGSWYIAYNQNELSGEAINTTRDWSEKPCNCTRSDLNLYNLWSKYLTITPGKAEFVSEDIWDIENNLYLSDTNWGLNLELSVYCDYTRTIIEQRDLFKDLFFYGLAMDFMREFAYNPNVRINRQQKNTLPSVEKILYEIDGDSRGREGGLLRDFRLSMDSIKMDFEGMDKLCMPCRRTGIKYGAI